MELPLDKKQNYTRPTFDDICDKVIRRCKFMLAFKQDNRNSLQSLVPSIAKGKRKWRSAILTILISLRWRNISRQKNVWKDVSTAELSLWEKEEVLLIILTISLFAPWTIFICRVTELSIRFSNHPWPSAKVLLPSTDLRLLTGCLHSLLIILTNVTWGLRGWMPIPRSLRLYLFPPSVLMLLKLCL